MQKFVISSLVGKTFIAVLFFGLGLILWAPSDAKAEIHLIHEAVTAPQNSVVTVPLYLNAIQPPRFSAAQIETTFPPSLRLIDVSTGSEAGQRDKVILSSITPNGVRYVIYGMNPNELGTPNGHDKIALLKFSLRDVPVGTYPITLSQTWTLLSSNAGMQVPVQRFMNGTIIVVEAGGGSSEPSARIILPQVRREHRGVTHGVSRVMNDPVVQFSTSVIIPEQSLSLTLIRNAQGQPRSVAVPFRVYLDSQQTRLFLRDLNDQPLALEGHAVYRLVLTRRITSLSRVPLAREVTFTFRTTMDHRQDNVVTHADPDSPTSRSRLTIPANSFNQEMFVILNPHVLGSPIQAELPAKVQNAMDRLQRTTRQRVLQQSLHEVAAFRAADGVIQEPQSPLTVVFSYSGQDLSALGQAEPVSPAESIQLAWLNPSTESWEFLPNARVDTDNKLVTASTTRLGAFAVVTNGVSTTTFSIFPFPVPFQPGNNASHQNIRFANTPRGTNIKIFTVNGDLVKELTTPDDSGQTVWDVTNISGDKVASDLYLYVAEITGSKQTGKLVIIR